MKPRLTTFLGLFLFSAGLLNLWAGELDREKARGKLMLKAVSKSVQDKFYDPELRGLDWKALTEETAARIDQARSVGEIFAAIYAQLDQLQDSHTKFVPPQRVTRFLFGFEIKAFGDDVLVYDLDEKGAAAQAGLRKGDRVVSFNGFAAERRTLDLMMIYFRVLAPQTTITLEIQRGDEAPWTLMIQGKKKEGLKVTDLTELDTIYSLIREAESDAEIFRHRLEKKGGVGYLSLPGMTASFPFFSRLVDEVKGAGAVVLDVRGNRGGAVKSLEDFIGFFEREPVEIAQQHFRKKTEPIKAKGRKNALEVPLVILVDSETASAAEVLARHFQRTGRATVIGDQTSGRVTVSEVFSEKIGTDVVIFYAAQVAVARLRFDDGEELEGKGVTPDIYCVPGGAQLAAGEDPCYTLAMGTAQAKIGSSKLEDATD